MHRAHQIIGWLFVAVFLVTGLYLRFFAADVIARGEHVRYSLRANHVYILMAALVNLALAIGPSVASAPRRRAMVGRLGHALALAAPPILLVSFLIEAPHPQPYLRPLTTIGAMCLAIGVFCIVGRARPPTPSRS